VTVTRILCGMAVCSALTVGVAAQGVPVVPTIIRPATASKPAAAGGFLQRWLILEPIAVPGQLTDSAVRTTVSRDYFPDQLTALPKNGDTVTVDGKPLLWHAVDTTNYNVNLFHFAAGLKKPKGGLPWENPAVRCWPKYGTSMLSRASVRTRISCTLIGIFCMIWVARADC